jgi:hypothetical protein
VQRGRANGIGRHAFHGHFRGGLMRRIIVAVTAAAALGTFAIPVSALADNSNRPGGSITTPEAPTPANGGDQGWGNCGHNSSGGNPHTGDNGNGGGNGGDHGQSCTGDTGGGGGNDGGGGGIPT